MIKSRYLVIKLVNNNCHYHLILQESRPIKKYPMDTIPRGHCIIINNYKFGKEIRRGSEKDVEKLSRLFRDHLGFKVEVRENLTADMVRQAMKEVQQYKHYSCLVVAVMSHGKSEGILGTDYQLVTVRDLVKYFTSTACQALDGKPKIFIIQACRSTSGEGDDSSTSGSILNSPEMADIAVMFATVDCQDSYRDVYKGSWFIQAIVETMEEHAATTSFQEILPIVSNRVGKRKSGDCNQLTMCTTTLQQRLDFCPIEEKVVSPVTESNVIGK